MVKFSFSRSAEQYRRFADRIVKDIHVLKADIEFEQDGGQILLAADYSEVFAYCMSIPDSFLTSKLLTSLDDSAHRALLNDLHESIMRFYLFEAGKPLWLLDPYLLDLRAFLRRVDSSHFKETVNDFGDAIKQIAIARTTPEYRELADLARRKGANAEGLAEQDRAKLFRFLERVAPALVRSRYTNARKPSDRLRRLLSEGRLLIPDDIPETVREGDSRTYDRWYSHLSRSRTRHDGSNVSDAQAVAALQSVNRWLMGQDKPRRLSLLTRSETMHEFMRSEVAAGHWGEAGGYPLRHPRVVLALLDHDADIVPSENADRRLQVLARWERIFEPIANVSREIDGPIRALQPNELMARHVAFIADIWARYCTAKATSITIDRDYVTSSGELDAIATLVDQDAMKRVLKERLSNLGSLLSGTHFVFATLISPELRKSNQIHRRQGDSRVRDRSASISLRYLQGAGFVQLLGAHGVPMPFRVRLGDTHLAKVLLDEAKNPFSAFSALSSRELMGDFRLQASDADGAKLESEAEWYVCMAYVCSAIGAWGATRRACEMIDGLDSSFTLESILLRAKATRHLNAEVDELRSVVHLMEDIFPQVSSKDEHVRILAERIKYEFLIAHRMARGEDGQDRDPWTIKARDTSTAGLNLIEGELKTPEECELINNIIYHAMQYHFDDTIPEGKKAFPLAEIADLFIRFEKGLMEIYGDFWQGWPDNFLDTYAWVRLGLVRSGNLTTESHDIERQKILLPLAGISKRQYVSDADMTDFQRHAAEARAFFADDDEMAPTFD